MKKKPRDNVDPLLERARTGDPRALDELLPLIYDELRQLAHRVRSRSPSSETLNTTSLVHEAYERLSHQSGRWNDRGHFFRVAATAMRHILVDDARKRSAQKRGGKRIDLDSSEQFLVSVERSEEILALNEALSRLNRLNRRRGEIVELRYFVGLTIAEAADVLKLSTATVKREWTLSRVWLRTEMNHGV